MSEHAPKGPQSAKGLGAKELLTQPSYLETPLPAGAEEYLRRDNPRLKELRARYQACDIAATKHSLWTDSYLEEEVSLAYFRGDSAYVWQYRDQNTKGRCLDVAAYLDTRKSWRGLSEEGGFGAYVFQDPRGRTISRDLLDSAVEIDFLERHLGMSSRDDLQILDVGAGYGRLGLHLTRALPNLARVYCTDAVAESTFLAEYYLRHHALKRAEALPIDRVESMLKTTTITLATNIHSFSECSLAAIAWWINLLATHEVPYLMIVPNADKHGGTELLSTESDGSERDYRVTIEDHGYKLIAKDPKFLDPDLQARGVSPTYHYLFKNIRSA